VFDEFQSKDSIILEVLFVLERLPLLLLLPLPLLVVTAVDEEAVVVFATVKGDEAIFSFLIDTDSFGWLVLLAVVAVVVVEVVYSALVSTSIVDGDILLDSAVFLFTSRLISRLLLLLLLTPLLPVLVLLPVLLLAELLLLLLVELLIALVSSLSFGSISTVKL
jgi:hypothetical protein